MAFTAIDRDELERLAKAWAAAEPNVQRLTVLDATRTDKGCDCHGWTWHVQCELTMRGGEPLTLWEPA